MDDEMVIALRPTGMLIVRSRVNSVCPVQQPCFHGDGVYIYI